MKKIIAIFIALIAIASPVQAADNQKTLVIIDNGYDASVTNYTKNIVAERCVSPMTASCPNKSLMQDGAGAAALSADQIKLRSTHGTEMLSAAVASNPDVKVVFIRLASFTKSGFLYGNDNDLANVLNWVHSNRSYLNVGAVSYSVSRTYKGTCPVHNGLNSAIENLKSAGIPFVAAAGNNYNVSQVSFPACINSAIAVGAVENGGYALYSNAGKELDFAANGRLDVVMAGTTKRINGTSVATQVFASSWVTLASKKSLQYNDLYSLIATTATPVKNTKVNALAIDMGKALA